MSTDFRARNIVIIGGGVIGCCTAYYLTRHPSYDRERDSVTIIEASGIAAAASGKAGGLLALWAYPSCIVSLSFQLHADLAAQHDGANRWGYRRIHSARLDARGQQKPARQAPSTSPDSILSVASSNRRSSRSQNIVPNVPLDLDWLEVENVNSYRSVGTPDNTAQVTPYEFTTAMAEMAVDAGAKIILGFVTSIDKEHGRITSITYKPRRNGGGFFDVNDSQTAQATDVVICAGPWASTLYSAAPVIGLHQSSVIMRNSKPLSAYMLFTEISLAMTSTERSQHVTPEILTRPNNTIWVAGDTDKLHQLPPTADEIIADIDACDKIIAQVGAISEELWKGQILAYQACYLPNVEADVPGPILGATEIEGMWIAVGHSCWGIQNGPGTGKLMAEFVYDGQAKSADVSELDIKHLRRS